MSSKPPSDPAASSPAAQRDRIYIRRRGRMTQGQARALATLTDRYCATEPTFQDSLPGAGPLGLEIGFGMGQALVDWCQSCPDWRMVGIEVYQPGIGAALLRADTAGVSNLTVLDGDAARIIAESIGTPWIDELRIFFPDPWPKKRHAKRRLLQPAFIADASARLKPGGLLRVATDWQPYAEWIHEVLAGEQRLTNLGGADGFAPRFAERGTTNFEARGRRLGHEVWDFLYQRR